MKWFKIVDFFNNKSAVAAKWPPTWWTKRPRSKHPFLVGLQILPRWRAVQYLSWNLFQSNVLFVTTKSCCNNTKYLSLMSQSYCNCSDFDKTKKILSCNSLFSIFEKSCCTKHWFDLSENLNLKGKSGLMKKKGFFQMETR